MYKSKNSQDKKQNEEQQLGILAIFSGTIVMMHSLDGNKRKCIILKFKRLNVVTVRKYLSCNMLT